MKRFAAGLCFSTLLAAGGPALAQGSSPGTDAILVFDASGSMWGQIDGVNKIVIARETVAGLLGDLPADQRLGLMVYGHNRKGDCADIEMLAPVGTDRGAIRTAVMGLNPKGMTPMTDAVIQAAEALKYAERRATVILVSDGEETCHADPCAAVAALEKLGVDLTVHTVGFGLESAEARNAREQLKCMAQATGGRYFSADSAGELSAALSSVAAAVSEPSSTPAADVIRGRLWATAEQGGPTIASGLTWTIRRAGSDEVVHQAENVGELELELPSGNLDVHVLRPADGASAQVTHNFANGTYLVLPILTHLAATLSAPDRAAAGDLAQVAWEGPAQEHDYLSVEQPGQPVKVNTYITYEYVAKGNPLMLRMPADPGRYEILYVQRNGYKALARRAIEVTAVGASVKAPATAPAGGQIEVSWTGPGYEHDYISAEEAGSQSSTSSYITYEYTSNGSPLMLTLPPDPGSYEIRYILHQDYSTLARQTIELTPVAASIRAPASGKADSSIEVLWSGPDYQHDYISVEKPEDSSSVGSYHTYSYTVDGSPLMLTLPSKPGQYEIRYIQGNGYRTLARQAITVTPAD